MRPIRSMRRVITGLLVVSSAAGVGPSAVDQPALAPMHE